MNRTTRKLSLTEAGEAYYREASLLLQQLDDLDATISDQTAEPRGFAGATVDRYRHSSTGYSGRALWISTVSGTPVLTSAFGVKLPMLRGVDRPPSGVTTVTRSAPEKPMGEVGEISTSSVPSSTVHWSRLGRTWHHRERQTGEHLCFGVGLGLEVARDLAVPYAVGEPSRRDGGEARNRCERVEGPRCAGQRGGAGNREDELGRGDLGRADRDVRDVAGDARHEQRDDRDGRQRPTSCDRIGGDRDEGKQKGQRDVHEPAPRGVRHVESLDPRARHHQVEDRRPGGKADGNAHRHPQGGPGPAVGPHGEPKAQGNHGDESRRPRSGSAWWLSPSLPGRVPQTAGSGQRRWWSWRRRRPGCRTW